MRGRNRSRPGGNAGDNIPGSATATEAALLGLWRVMDDDQQVDLWRGPRAGRPRHEPRSRLEWKWPIKEPREPNT